jgi:hypothetical protein
MATGSGYYTSIDAIHNRHYPKQIAWKFETANLRPAAYILMQKVVILNTCRILRLFFCKTVNKKCLVSESRTVVRTS